MSDEEVVWEATVDNNTWRVRVVRVDPYGGNLEVYRVSDNERVYVQAVNISFDAIFGPDVSDVIDWENIAIRVIDAEEA